MRTTYFRAALGVLLLASLVPGYAQQMYKCGAVYQDRPCASEDLQQRYSSASGGFSINQVNPNTDKDCAAAVATAMPLWQRMNNGESLETLKAEIDAKPISRYEKSQIRDSLVALREFKGTPTQVRSQFESNCMAYKHRKGIPSERQIASGASVPAPATSYANRRDEIAAERAATAAARAAEAAARAAQRR